MLAAEVFNFGAWHARGERLAALRVRVEFHAARRNRVFGDQDRHLLPPFTLRWVEQTWSSWWS